MELSYYPGCTLKTKAKNFEDSAIASMTALGINLKEIPRWNCCGAASPGQPGGYLVHS